MDETTPIHRLALFAALCLTAGCASAGEPAAVTDAGPNAIAGAASPVDATPALTALTHTSLPAWTDKYRRAGAPPRFLIVGELMSQHGLARHEAVEVQNFLRDAVAAGRSASDALLTEAISAVRAGRFERRYDAKRIADAPFVVVFDLDETLWDQRVRAKDGCHDLVVTSGKKERRVKMTPGWQDAIRSLHAAGGAVVLFSANLDTKIADNLKAIMLDGTSLWDHPLVAAVLTNSHLTLQSKHEGKGKAKPRRGSPVVEPSKDLRQFDPTLSRVIIVDDNPRRLFQYGNTRVFKKFHGDVLCNSPAAERTLLDKQLPSVVAEVLDAASYAKKSGVSFVQAYRPFTMLGQDALRALRSAHGWDDAAAIAYIREHPGVVGTRY